MCHSKWLIEVSVKDPMPNDSEIAQGLEQALNKEPVLGWSAGQAAWQSQLRGVLRGVLQDDLSIKGPLASQTNWPVRKAEAWIRTEQDIPLLE